ncbi:hypothetical protein AGOR_G00149640 [Albula goreensis]|uniref:SH3 domain-containing protein n=1 Tax=Albula goreensis TaxID=1534307 RepID=A0A8T3DBS0_9TELE|nr:hypothetical protein AGOR_G00149640 [Albula goreensis]
MEQEGALDFKALRAKFQEEAALKQMKNKPAIPEKPKLIPPPGARVSLLSSINAAVENKSAVIPRVVFKDAKPGSEAKRTHSFPVPFKAKEPIRDSNFNTELLHHQQKKEGDVVKQAFKDGKFPLVLPVPPVVQKVDPDPPAKSLPPPPKKKAILPFKTKSSKSGKGTSEAPTNAIAVPAKPIKGPDNAVEVSTNGSEVVADLIHTPTDVIDPPADVVEALAKVIEPPTSVEAPAEFVEAPADVIDAPADVIDAPADVIEAPADVVEAPADVVDAPADVVDAPADVVDAPADVIDAPADVIEAPADVIEAPADVIEAPADVIEAPADVIEAPADVLEAPADVIEAHADVVVPSADFVEPPADVDELLPDVIYAPPDISDFPDDVSEGPANDSEGPADIAALPVPSVMTAELPEAEAPKLENGDVLHELGSGSEPQSPNSERADTIPSAEETAEEASTGSRTPPCDQRVLNALEKAKKKFSPGHLLSQARSKSASPVDDNPPCEMTPTRLCPELPPIDYEDPIADAHPDIPTATIPNGFDSPSLRQSSPSLEGSVELEVEDLQPGVQAVTPPPRKPLPDLQSLGPSPEKPARPPSVDLSPYQTTVTQTYVDNAPGASALDLPVEAPEAVEFDVPQLETPAAPDFETSEFETPEAPAADLLTPGVPEHNEDETPDLGAQDVGAPQGEADELGDPEFGSQEIETPEAETVPESAPDSPDSPTVKDSEPLPGPRIQDSHYESCDNVYEDVETAKFRRGPNTRKRKGPPKNPYADSQPASEESHKSSWFFNSRNERKTSPETHDDKEQKKKEKQRLEKEKKEQKEREKKENEMKKKFKITGQEEPMYQAKVAVASKGRKNDLTVKNGDIISIIRTTNCPKGKWLARDSNNKYGYISLKSVELDIKEMLELGKKASQAAGRPTTAEVETISVGSRSSNHYPLSAGSFSDDSEEWTCDDEDTLSPTENKGHSRTISMPEMYNDQADVQTATVDGISEDDTMQARHEALQKLATFFQKPREIGEVVAEDTAAGTEEESSLLYPVEETNCLGGGEEVMEILPPPALYADHEDDGLPSLPTAAVE